MKYEPINLSEKFNLFAEHWQPKIIAEMNDYQIKLVRVKGPFVWHGHQDTDEMFMVIEGNLRIDFRDGAVNIGPGEVFVVPKGVEHRPFAENETKMVVMEPRGVVNTGDSGGDKIAANDVWI